MSSRHADGVRKRILDHSQRSSSYRGTSQRLNVKNSYEIKNPYEPKDPRIIIVHGLEKDVVENAQF